MGWGKILFYTQYPCSRYCLLALVQSSLNFAAVDNHNVRRRKRHANQTDNDQRDEL